MKSAYVELRKAPELSALNRASHQTDPLLYFPLAINTKCGSGPVPVRDDFAVNGRHGRQFWVHAQSGPNGLSYLSGKPDTNRLSETILICRVAAQCFQDPVQAGLRPSKWRCAGRARRSIGVKVSAS